MNTLEAISGRRSIRKFKSTPVPREAIETILEAARQAPSGKNRQPWHFIVVQGERCQEMVRVMRSGIEKARAAGRDLSSSEGTARFMEQAPVTVFIFYPQSAENTPDVDWTIVDVQSIGAAIQNMLLAAEDLGLGTLWICDVFYAYDELRQWLGREDQMIAAVSIGYPDEAPGPRPRRPLEELVTWLGE